MAAHVTISTHMLGDSRVGQIVGQKCLTNEETINEAIEYGYVTGKLESISASAKGVLKAMLKGVERDGDGRKIDNKFSIQAYANGRLDDITDDLDLAKIGVNAVARALKDLTLDTSGWTFVIEGTAGSVNVTSISTGEAVDTIVVGEDVSINGTDLALGTGDVVAWSVPGTQASGTVAAAKLTSDSTRISVTGDALAALASATYNGKTIVFDLKIGNRRAVKSATLVVV